MPVEIDELESWGVGDRMLADMLRGIHPDMAREIEWRRGALPPGLLGWRKATEVRETAMNLAVAALTHRQVEPRRSTSTSSCRAAVGSPAPSRPSTATGWSRSATPSSTASSCSSRGSGCWRSRPVTPTTTGRPSPSGGSPRGSQAAQRLLGPTVDEPLTPAQRSRGPLRRGRRAPLAAADQDVVRLGLGGPHRPGARPEALKKWKSSRYPGEDAGPAHVRVWGEHADLDGLTRLGELAERALAAAAAQRAGAALITGAFDLLAPLPEGATTTVLEASAGTGKTYALAALVTRYLAEGKAVLDDMLLITFSRAASQELRERVRDQLVAAAEALDDPSSVDPDDTLLCHLVDGTDESVKRSGSGCATPWPASTPRPSPPPTSSASWCCGPSGVAGDTDAGVTLVENLDQLVGEIVDDLYLQRFGDVKDTPALTRAQALELAHEVVRNPRTRLTPLDPPAETTAGVRRAFADDVLRELERRKRLLGILGFDDLLGRLAVALEADDAPARDRMRRRWRIVMVDEFQDTDPVQWEVIERAFVGQVTLVLIGDPKQAIYAFRGGDVVTYLRARERRRRAAHPRHQLPQRRAAGATAPPVLEGAALGHDDIVVRDVAAHRPLIGWRARPATTRSGCAWSPATRSGSAAPAPSRWTTCARSSRPTSRPTSSGCSPPARPTTAATVRGAGRRRHRREPPRRPGLPRRARGGRGAGRLHRRHRRLRLPGRGRLAVPARGVRAAAAAAAWSAPRRPACSSVATAAELAADATS